MPRPKRTQQTPDLRERILATAWAQIATDGSAALSLRAIARALNITAPAIYNYFPDRDALVTALIIEAYTSFGSAQLAARDALPATDLAGRLRAVGEAYRVWAVAYPERYELIFGAPIAGYVCPMEQTLPAGARALGVIVSVVEGFRQAGQLRPLTGVDLPVLEGEVGQAYLFWQQYGGEAALVSLAVTVLIWARVHGLVSLEIGGHMPPFGPTAVALYQYELDRILQEFFLPPPSPPA
jgi:AcrR family transcriptional regulator